MLTPAIFAHRQASVPGFIFLSRAIHHSGYSHEILFWFEQVIRMVGESTEAVGVGAGQGTSGNKMPTLEEYGTNLTKLAEEVNCDTFFVFYLF